MTLALAAILPGGFLLWLICWAVRRLGRTPRCPHNNIPRVCQRCVEGW